MKSWIFYSRFKGKRSCDSKLVAMAECSANPDQINPNHCSCEVQQNQPSHSTVEQKVTEEALTKPSKYLPNGKVRLLVDDNGLVTQTALDAEQDSYALLQEDVSSNNCYCDINKDDSEINGCRPKNRKSVDCHLSELASEFDTLELENNLKEQTPNVENAESIHDLERDILNGIEYVVYKSEEQMPDIMRLITKDLSEPYSIYTYRYFIHNWPKLCFLAMSGDKCVGAIVCKLDMHKKMVRRGYIAMLAIDSEYRRRKIGSHLVLKAIKAMIADDCDEVVLETEITNQPALRLYENLGFVRDKRLFRYYLNGVDALRLKLWLR